MAGPLVVCASCSSHVLSSDEACPHCGSNVRDGKGQALGRTATAVLMGLALAGCPAEDDTSDTMGGEGSSSTANSSMSGPGSSGTTTEGTTAVTFPDPTEQAAAYGSPDTETFGSTDITESDSTSTGGDTDTDTDTDTDGSSSGSGSSSSTGISPDYGVPTTGE